MKIATLKVELDKLGIPGSAYSLNGSIGPDTMVLDNWHGVWSFFYVGERGGQGDKEYFAGEDDACQFLYDYFKDVQRKYVDLRTHNEH